MAGVFSMVWWIHTGVSYVMSVRCGVNRRCEISRYADKFALINFPQSAGYKQAVNQRYLPVF
jgi:hypothetical protein